MQMRFAGAPFRVGYGPQGQRHQDVLFRDHGLGPVQGSAQGLPAVLPARLVSPSLQGVPSTPGGLDRVRGEVPNATQQAGGATSNHSTGQFLF